MNLAIELAGVRLRLQLRFPQTARAFRDYLVEENCEGWDIRVDDGDTEIFSLICPEGRLTPLNEEYILMARASSFLLPRRRVLFHGVSFVWRGRAWIITALSGVGKTTQLRHWQRLFPEEIRIINGDKSVLSWEDDCSFRVWPSPWTGKEGDAGTLDAPLAGIVLLRQADHNAIRRIEPRESVMEIFQQFLVLDEDPRDLRLTGAMEDALLRQTPVWLLENLGDEDSARLTYETLSEYEAVKHEDL